MSATPGLMTRVVLESPYAGPTPADVEENVRFARACIRDCLRRNEAPIASHLLFTQPGILDDNVPEERALGIAAGHTWVFLADRSVVYVDRGVSRGMIEGIRVALARAIPVDFRRLDRIPVKWEWIHEKNIPHEMCGLCHVGPAVTEGHG